MGTDPHIVMQRPWEGESRPSSAPRPSASLMPQPPGHELGLGTAGSASSPLSSKKMYVALGGEGAKVTSRGPGEVKTNTGHGARLRVCPRPGGWSSSTRTGQGGASPSAGGTPPTCLGKQKF